MHLSNLPVNFTLSTGIFYEISEVQECPVFYDNIVFCKNLELRFYTRNAHATFYENDGVIWHCWNICIVVRVEFPRPRCRTSSKHTLGAPDALVSHMQNALLLITFLRESYHNWREYFCWSPRSFQTMVTNCSIAMNSVLEPLNSHILKYLRGDKSFIILWNHFLNR